jgi:hypothetical protein
MKMKTRVLAMPIRFSRTKYEYGFFSEADDAQCQIDAEKNRGHGDEPHAARREDPRKEHAEQEDVEQPYSVTTVFHDDRKDEHCREEHDQQGEETGVRQPVGLEISDQISHGVWALESLASGPGEHIPKPSHGARWLAGARADHRQGRPTAASRRTDNSIAPR